MYDKIYNFSEREDKQMLFDNLNCEQLKIIHEILVFYYSDAFDYIGLDCNGHPEIYMSKLYEDDELFMLDYKETGFEGLVVAWYVGDITTDKLIETLNMSENKKDIHELFKERNAEYYEICEELDWCVDVDEDDCIVTLRQDSPAGEDFFFEVNTADFCEEVWDYAKGGFDPEEHCQMWIEARQYRPNSGIPSTFDLVDDARKIQTMLDELANALDEFRNKPETITESCEQSESDIEKAENQAVHATSEWVEESEKAFNPKAHCKICGREAVYQIVDNRWEYENFCPHCGAQMSSKLVLVYVGNDSCDRPVYRNNTGNLYVDTNPRADWQPSICTKCDNAFDGEPDYPVSEDTEFEFIPKRVTW